MPRGTICDHVAQKRRPLAKNILSARLRKLVARGALDAGPASDGSAYQGGPDAAMIRVVLPHHLRALAGVGGGVKLDVEGPATQRSLLDALGARFPVLRGTIRDQVTHQRRPMLRVFACEEDLSNEPPDAPLPDAVASGAGPFFVVGAIAGGQPSSPPLLNKEKRPRYPTLT
jgi:hypothetical protein